jgi:hypothetical protein
MEALCLQSNRHRPSPNSTSTGRGLELRNVALQNAGLNSLVFRNTSVPETFRVFYRRVLVTDQFVLSEKTPNVFSSAREVNRRASPDSVPVPSRALYLRAAENLRDNPASGRRTIRLVTALCSPDREAERQRL